MSAEKVKVIDKSKWQEGPWKQEADRKEWEHEGFPCLIVRVESHGALCGYVAVPPGHPWHGKDYDSVEAEVHGGLTYGSKCHGAVCHVPKPGEPDDVFWLGFDHAHAGDFCPGQKTYQDRQYATLFGGDDGSFMADGTYRDMDYVTQQVNSLAEQAAKVQGVDRRRNRKPQGEFHMNNKRRADYKIVAVDRDTGRQGHLGVGWINPDGTVSLTLNMCTVIDTSLQCLTITLIPNTPAHAENNGHATAKRGS